jgi:hypothetical protein
MHVKSQIGAREKYLQTIIGTTWLYPMVDIRDAMASTGVEFVFDGNNFVCPDYTNLNQLLYDIWYKTYQKINDGGAGGYSLGPGTLLRDLGKEITFQYPDGKVVVRWRLVQQITPQSSLPPADVGLSYDGTIGYITVFQAFGISPPGSVDPAYVVRVG